MPHNLPPWVAGVPEAFCMIYAVSYTSRSYAGLSRKPRSWAVTRHAKKWGYTVLRHPRLTVQEMDMNDERKTKAQLSAELKAVRQRVIELEAAEAERQQADAALRAEPGCSGRPKTLQYRV